MQENPYKHTEAGADYIRAVGRRLRWVREEIGWSQVRAAQAAGVDQSTWTKYERGKRLASVFHLARIVEDMGTSLDFIFRGKIGGLMRRDLELVLVARHPELVLGKAEASALPAPSRVTHPAS